MQKRSASRIAGTPRRIAVLRALALGDMMCGVPALRALRRAWPSAEISLIGLPWAREFVMRFDQYIDRFLEFPGYPGLPEREPQIAALPGFFSALQREEFDLIVQLHGSGRFVNEIVALCGARQSAGFYMPGDFVPSEGTYRLWPKTGSEIHRLLTLLDFLGLATAGDALEFPLNETDFAALADLSSEINFAEEAYVVVHPGASVSARRWPSANFAAVADALAKRGLAVVLTGVESELAIVAEVASAMRQPGVHLCGQTDLGTLGALVAGARLVVCNDTGISHVAAATRTPSVVISTGDNPARWAPLDGELHQVLCRPEGVGSGEVWRAAGWLLDCASLQEAPTPVAMRSTSDLKGWCNSLSE